MSRSRACLAASVIALAACSSGGGGSPSSSQQGEQGVGEDGAVGCSGTVDTYVANLTKAGELGDYTFVLVSASPAPPDLDGNSWTVSIKDASGASPSLAQIAVQPFMPQMGHGSDQVPQVAANADGTFGVSNIYLFMPGLWTITFTVTAPPGDGGVAKTLDKGVFSFCVGG